jgi:hypothetical protein
LDLKEAYSLVQPGLNGVKKDFKNLVDSQSEFSEMEKMLRQVLVGGKIVRPTLTLLAGSFYNYDLVVLQPMATSTELMHIPCHPRRRFPICSRRRTGCKNWEYPGSFFVFADAGDHSPRRSKTGVVSLQAGSDF